MAITMEERLLKLKEKISDSDGCDELVLICEDEEAHSKYYSQIDTWKNKRRLLHPIASNKQISTIGKPYSGHPSVIIFGLRFLQADDFLKEILKTLRVSNYDPEKVKIEYYKIV